jgi:hypothetical protein
MRKQRNDDLIFYVARGDAWSGGSDNYGPELLKLGRVRLLSSDTVSLKK